MPEKKQRISKQEDDDSSAPSVFDFLYQDSARIGSFLAQFEVGHLKQITQTKGQDSGTQETTAKQGKLGVPGVGTAALTGTQQTTLSTAQGYERVFDPYWSNARAFLNFVNEHNFLVSDDLSEAHVGQLIYAGGELGVVDIKMLKNAWDVKSIQAQIKSGMDSGPSHTHSAAAKAAKKQADQAADFMIDIMKIMPHTVQAFFATEKGERIWGTMAEENLVTPPGDLALKHGIMIQGEWKVVGILDAFPTPEIADEDFELQAQQAVVQTLTLLGGSPLAQFILHLAPAAKMLLGRPNSAYGITPLLIFREVT